MKQINANNSVVMFHGIKAYTGRYDSVYESIKKVDNLVDLGKKGAEICTADKPIGSLGVLVSGHLSNLFVSDVWSEADNKGKRHTNGYSSSGYDIYDALFGLQFTQARVNLFCSHIAQKARKSWYIHGEYAEGWMIPEFVVGIWINKYASSKDKKLARILARRHGVELFVVDDKTSMTNLTPAPLLEEQEEMEKVWFAFAMSLMDIDPWERRGKKHQNTLLKRGLHSHQVRALFSYFEMLERAEVEKLEIRAKHGISKIFNQFVCEE